MHHTKMHHTKMHHTKLSCDDRLSWSSLMLTQRMTLNARFDWKHTGLDYCCKWCPDIQYRTMDTSTRPLLASSQSLAVISIVLYPSTLPVPLVQPNHHFDPLTYFQVLLSIALPVSISSVLRAARISYMYSRCTPPSRNARSNRI